MEKTTDFLKRYLPVFILILCCLIFATRFSKHFILPLYDETVYASGNFWHHKGWSPGYRLYYYLLNSLTQDSFKSLYYSYFAMGAIFTPFLTYLTLRNLSFNIESSAYGAVLALLSEWNHSVGVTKIQIFNYLILLCIFNLRWWLLRKKESHQKAAYYTFYLLMLLSLYIRQDNMLILGIIFSWDLYYSKNKKKILLFMGAILAFFLIKINLFNEVFADKRQVDTLLDHYWFAHHNFLSSLWPSGSHRHIEMARYFGFPESMWEIIKNRPTFFFQHLYYNLKELPHFIMDGLSIGTDKYWQYPFWVKIFFIITSIKFFSHAIEVKDKKRANLKEIQIFSLALAIKCIAICLLLSWWNKYYFEIAIIIMIGSIFLLTKITPHRLKERLKKYNFIWFLIPLIFFFFHEYVGPVYAEKGLEKVVSVLRQENARMPVNRLFCDFSFYSQPTFSPRSFDVYFHPQYHEKASKGFVQFLHERRVDTVIFYESYRKLLIDIGYEAQLKDFEEKHLQYGYEIKYDHEKQQTIYRIKKDIYERWQLDNKILTDEDEAF